MPDGLPERPAEDRGRPLPALETRFLPPPGFVWGSFAASDGATLRWGHLAVPAPRAECVIVGGFAEFIEKHFETVRDLAARGLSVWCLDWRGQGGSARPKRLPSRPRSRRYARDAAELVNFAETMLTTGKPRLLFAHSMGGAIALLSLGLYPGRFAGAVLSAPMLRIRTARVPPMLVRCITAPARVSGFGACFIPGAGPWRADRLPSPERSRISSDDARCRLRHAWFSAAPELRVDAPTYGWVDSSLAISRRISRPGFLAGIETPVLIGSPGIESFVVPQAHRRAARLLPDCRLVELPDSKHEPFLERDAIRDRWFAEIDRFLAERLGAAESPAPAGL
jgi:lysophospholipase